MLTLVLQPFLQYGVAGAVAVLFIILYVRKDRQVERTYATLVAKMIEVTTAWQNMSHELEATLRERRQADALHNKDVPTHLREADPSE